MLFLLIISLCSISFVKANQTNSNLDLFGKVIYLDAGHGGVDPGCVYKDIYEKDINLSIVLKLEKMLEAKGASVYLTRYGDYDLSTINAYGRKKSDLNNRARIINESKADIYISIHLNSINSSNWSGAQVFYDDVNKQNKVIAEVMTESLKTKREFEEISDMLLNRKIKVPGVLIEAGFLSNPNDRYLLKQESYQEKLCENITSGILKYFGLN